MYYWSMSWDPIYKRIVLRDGNRKVNFIFQTYSKSREQKCQHKWRNLMSIDWVRLHFFLEWRISVLSMFIFIYLGVVMADLEIKIYFSLMRENQWKFFFACKKFNLVVTWDSWRNWRKPRRPCLLIDIRTPASRIWSRCANPSTKTLLFCYYF